MDGEQFDALTERLGGYRTCPVCGQKGFVSDMALEPGAGKIELRVEHSRPRQATTWPQATKTIHTGKMPLPTEARPDFQ